MRVIGLATVALISTGARLNAQHRPSIVGTWRVAPRVDTRGGPREVVIRADSSASWGKETSRWRLTGHTIWIAVGGEWERYRLTISRTELTLSGGDLQKPITLRRVGPPNALPPGVLVPPDPDSKS